MHAKKRQSKPKKGVKVGNLIRVETYFKTRSEVDKIDRARQKDSRSEYIREAALTRADNDLGKAAR